MKFKNIYKGGVALCLAATLAGCSDDFLTPEPKSFYEPTEAFKSVKALEMAMAMCDSYLLSAVIDGNWNHVSTSSNYLMTDMGVYAKTDMGNFEDNFAAKLTPTSGMYEGGDNNAIFRFWLKGYKGVKYANTILTYIDGVEGLDEETKNLYKGRAYFHRAYRYYYLTLQFGDIPLVTKIITEPKRDYKTTSKEAIFKMLVHDLEFAVEHVPSYKEFKEMGKVNKEACQLLLAKCYLVTGQYDKAEAVCDDLINNSGLHLMTEPFGSFIYAGNTQTWDVLRNVIWDLNRPENVCDPSNKEMIMPILNFSPENHTNYMIMRSHGMNWSGGTIIDPAGYRNPALNMEGKDKFFTNDQDWVACIGRGIGVFRTSPYFNKTLWYVNGVEDTLDLRHNREVGNWVNMEDITYNHALVVEKLDKGLDTERDTVIYSPFYGKHLQLYATEDYQNEKGETVVKAGDLLCSDTLRCWYPLPLYKYYIYQHNFYDNRANESQLNGAQNKEDNANMYLFRMAEAYLVRAEAKFYQGKDATSDVNIIRQRAKASQMYTSVTIGDIVAERARELYNEEYRQSELARVSWCLAKSGKPDEWGNTYDIKTWDKQAGVDDDLPYGVVPSSGSYWYRRTVYYNLYNHGPIVSNGKAWNFRVDKRNIFWPIPQDEITANAKAPLRQNYGYDGYDETVPMFDNWEDAMADEK